MNWRFKFRLFQASTYGIVFSAIILMAIVTGKYIETLSFFVAFVTLRETFGKTYHSSSFWKCILISVVVFVISILFMPNKNLTILACIVFALIVDYIAYKYQDYIDLHEIVNRPFNVEHCTEADLISRCREVNLSEENTKLAVEFFIKKTKQSQIADMLFIDEKSVQAKKRRLRKILNK